MKKDKNINLQTVETIAAIATPAGRGGVSIVRVSGPLSNNIALSMLAKTLPPRQACFNKFYAADGQVIDQGIALFFKAPGSFTGEDILELQGHGGPVVMDMLLQEVLANGARLARPGEFSERAYLNNKIDLAQAEAIADLIDSQSQQAVRSALHSLQGVFSQHIHDLVEELISLRSYIEAAIDFVDEEIDFLAEGQVLQRLHNIQEKIEHVQVQAKQGVLLRDGLNLVIAGPPNAGKSSLLNALVAKDVAIVTEWAGTTRDVLKEHMVLDGLPLHIIDTAGLHDNSNDPIEKIGIKKAQAEIQKADMILLVFDDCEYTSALCRGMMEKISSGIKIIIVRNKIDLSGANAQQKKKDNMSSEVFVSVKNLSGLDLLKAQIKEYAGYLSGNEDVFIARRRHIEALQSAAEHLCHGDQQLQMFNASELLAEDLRLAQNVLSTITGTYSSDDLLGDIFSSFCIGK